MSIKYIQMPLIQQFNIGYISQIIDLYVKTFSAGLSQQYIDMTELHQYIDVIINNGFSLLANEDEIVIGALLSYPLAFDILLPPEINNSFSIDKSIYVAEMMVAEQARGMGIGTQLLNEFFQTVDTSIFTDAFIRVWDKNSGAISLYQKHGFEMFTSIEQTKMEADGNDTFVMKKIYLHKKLV